MNTRFIDWILNVRGSLALGQGQAGEDGRLLAAEKQQLPRQIRRPFGGCVNLLQ